MNPHAKSFLKNLFALQKKLGATDNAFSTMTGKHHDTLDNWKAQQTFPTSGDIAHVCKRLSVELTKRRRNAARILSDANAVESFIVAFLNPGFTAKKVSR